MKKFLITVSTAWCGMDNTVRAYAENQEEFEDLAQQEAYDNFCSHDCVSYIADELFPDQEGDYTDAQWDEAYSVESEYYSYEIKEVEEDDEDFFSTYDLLYDGRKKEV